MKFDFQNQKQRGSRALAMVASATFAALQFAQAAQASSINTVEGLASGTTATIDQNPVVTAILSQPSTVNGFTFTNWAFLANDGTGSLTVFGAMPTGSGYTPTVDDAITASGKYSPFHQIPELVSLTSILRVSTGNAVPGPQVATIPQLNLATQPFTNVEYLWTLNNVTISGQPGPNWGNGATGSAANQSLTVTDAGSHAMTLFYWPSSYSADAAFYGTAIPMGAVNMTGFVSVFGGVAEFTPLSFTSVPEPSSLALAVFGTVALTFGFVRRARSAGVPRN